MAWITVAPVKALALVFRDVVELTPQGAPEDRRFHLVDGRGRLVNGKRLGRLVQVRPEWDPVADRLSLSFPDGSVVEGAVTVGEELSSHFYGFPRQGRVVLGPFSAALSEWAGAELRLVRSDRPGVAIDRGRGGAVSLLSEAACDGFDPRRFRMLFGIAGVPPHAEDEWVGYRVGIGDAVVRPTGHTGRCLITSQNPDTGRPDLDMLQHIRDTRPDDTSEPLPFGVHGSVAQPGAVRVGDPVVLL